MALISGRGSGIHSTSGPSRTGAALIAETAFLALDLAPTRCSKKMSLASSASWSLVAALEDAKAVLTGIGRWLKKMALSTSL